jgi:hypothetical protein
MSGCVYGGSARAALRRGDTTGATPPVAHGESGREVKSPVRARRMVRQLNNPRRCAEKIVHRGLWMAA